jgi:hypothetical protein
MEKLTSRGVDYSIGEHESKGAGKWEAGGKQIGLLAYSASLTNATSIVFDF